MEFTVKFQSLIRAGPPLWCPLALGVKIEPINKGFITHDMV